MTKSVLAVVASFEPTEMIVSLVSELIAQGVDVRVVDDASRSEEGRARLRACERIGAFVVRKDSNKGIGDSLNVGLALAEESSARYLLTMDQDTLVPEGYVASCVKVFERLDRLGLNGGMVTAGLLNGRYRSPRLRVGETGFFEAIDPMQSGSLVLVSAARVVGGFREEFVMDCVDVDFCLKMRAAGFRVVWNDAMELRHNLGTMTRITIFGHSICVHGHEVSVSNHSDMRRYYMTRNRSILEREFRLVDPIWYRKARKAHRRDMLKAILFEPGRGRRARTILEALVDAKMRRTGERS